MQLLRDEVTKKTDRGLQIQDRIEMGEMVEDEIIMSLIEKRLKETDCKVNGWVMDGFPKTV